jgi:hypothetical protein
MEIFKNHQRPRRKYRFYIVGHKKALKGMSHEMEQGSNTIPINRSPFKDVSAG